MNRRSTFYSNNPDAVGDRTEQTLREKRHFFHVDDQISLSLEYLPPAHAHAHALGLRPIRAHYATRDNTPVIKSSTPSSSSQHPSTALATSSNSSPNLSFSPTAANGKEETKEKIGDGCAPPAATPALESPHDEETRDVASKRINSSKNCIDGEEAKEQEEDDEIERKRTEEEAKVK